MPQQLNYSDRKQGQKLPAVVYWSEHLFRLIWLGIALFLAAVFAYFRFT